MLTFSPLFTFVQFLGGEQDKMGVSAAVTRFLAFRQGDFYRCLAAKDNRDLTIRFIRIGDQGDADIRHIGTRRTGFNLAHPAL